MATSRKITPKRVKNPAEKAWDTQRERYSEEEISCRQREAALKAWETRRKNAKKAAKHTVRGK